MKRERYEITVFERSRSKFKYYRNMASNDMLIWRPEFEMHNFVRFSFGYWHIRRFFFYIERKRDRIKIDMLWKPLVCYYYKIHNIVLYVFLHLVIKLIIHIYFFIFIIFKILILTKDLKAAGLESALYGNRSSAFLNFFSLITIFLKSLKVIVILKFIRMVLTDLRKINWLNN